MGWLLVAGALYLAYVVYTHLRARAWKPAVAVAGLALLLAGGAIASDPWKATGSNGQAAGFCDRHDCIPSFSEGGGSIVKCRDGMWSHSGGIQGACSGHGGEASFLDSAP